jgi:putative phosphoesterase
VRVAAIADIHGNLPALEAVLAEIEREHVEQVVVAGDTISGPWPADVFDALAEAGAIVVRGNVDRLALAGGEGAIGEWSLERLGARRATVAEWPLTATLEVDGLGRVLVCHATPSSDERTYTPITPEQEILALLGDIDADVVVTGHIHVQYDRTLSNGLRIVNPGSVGMPYDGGAAAYWALLGPDVELRRTEYDVEAAIVAMRRTGAPDVEEQLVRYLRDPPARTEALEYFESNRGA